MIDAIVMPLGTSLEDAAHGKSTLGIPKKVGEEFVSKDGAK